MKVVWCVLIIVSCIWAHPHPHPSTPADTVEDGTSDIKQPLPSTFVSEASQLIAMELLKHNKDIDANQVHSPLGVSAILAVLAEASSGETYEEFHKVLGYPKERSSLRQAFQRILANYQNRDANLALPSFQTWLYIYQNNSANDAYKQVLRQNYYVSVKDVNRQDYDWSDPNTTLSLESDLFTTEPSNSKDVIGFETLKRINLDDVDDIDAPKVGDVPEELLNKEASKFDRFVDDKQYVEKPVALAEAEQLKRQQQLQEQQQQAGTTVGELGSDATDSFTEVLTVEKLEKPAEKENLEDKQQNKRSDVDANNNSNVNVEENETVQEDEKPRKQPSKQIENTAEANGVGKSDHQVLPTSGNEPEKVRLPLQKLENAVKTVVKESTDEIMLALESHLSAVSRVYGARSLFRTDDIASALSANSITGRSIDSKTKMLLFNGLYFRGSWAQPFYKLRNTSVEEFFFMTNDDAIKTPMMHAKGKFRIIDFPLLKARGLALPYENPKYALCIILPNEPEGLSEVIAQIQPSDFKYANEHAEFKDVHVTLPKFQVEETSHSETMLKQLGLKRLFSRELAQLNLLSDDEDLHVDAIVQFVIVRVDEGGSDASSLSEAISQGRSPIEQTQPEEEKEDKKEFIKFEVNRPFAYFIMDFEEQIVLASGKVYTPELKIELPPVSIEVELEQA